MIDPFKRCLTDRVTLETFTTETTLSSVFSVIPSENPGDAGGSTRKADHEDSKYAHRWTDFPGVTEPSLGKVVTITTTLHITTDGQPVYTPCRKLHGEKKVQVEEQLRQWEAEKVIERCDSNWASTIHAMMKPDGSWRVCGDFRRLNTIIKLDRYPLPALTTFNERLAGCSVFSKIELRQAFQQVHVDEASQDKTAIITTLSLFKFLRMPYGLKNAAQGFQRNVHQLLSAMPLAHFLYMYDLIVGSKCKEDFPRNLHCLFHRLKDKMLLLNRNKCQLGEPSLTFLGHVVDSCGISIPTERVEAIKRFPVPTTPKELESFLCEFVHFSIAFVRHASGKMAPLTQLKNISRQKDFEEACNPVHDRAFCATKEAIANATLLVHPLPRLQT